MWLSSVGGSNCYPLCPKAIRGWSYHIPFNLVVDHWTSAVESSSLLDFLSLYAMWTPFGRLINYKIMSTISVACDFTTKSGGI